MAFTLEELSELVETLQQKISTLETAVSQYRLDIQNLETQLSQSITTDQLTVTDTVKVAGQDIKDDREQIQNNSNSISVNESSISTNTSDISTNKSDIAAAKDELKGELSQVVDGTTELKQLNVAGNQLPQNLNVGIINDDRYAVIGAHDLWFGHSARKGEPGRAIVDGGDGGLIINYFDNVDPGWPFVEIRKELKVQGEIKIPSAGTISSTGRMHISGEERLYLLNKSGVIVGKDWGGTGNLQVQGEIKGKLWFSDEFVLNVPNNGTIVSVRMHHADKCFAVITNIQGAFSGGGERVWVEVNRQDGFWYLLGHSLQPDVQVKARCVGSP